MDNVMGVIKDIFDHINDVKQDLTSQQKYIESDINLMKKLIDDIRDDDIMNLNLEINNDKYHDIVDKIYLLKINIKVLIEKLLYLLNQNVSFIR